MRFFLAYLLWLPSAVSAQTPPEPASLAADASVAAPVAAAGDAAAVIVSAEQWARPRSGQAVAAFPGFAALVAQLDRDPGERLVLRFARGDEATLWAEELRAWLVALGLSSARVELEPGVARPDELRLELRRGRTP